MNEIKYRIWDKQESKFVDRHTLLCIYPEGQVVVYTSDDGGKNGLWEHEIYSGIQGLRYVTQQFTGKTDSKGKALYEGDILKSIFPNIKSLREIRWHDKEGGWYLRFVCSGQWDGPLAIAFSSVWEYCGNIFKNPELLE